MSHDNNFVIILSYYVMNIYEACMNRKNQYSLLLLAGGKSSRMGKNKAELVYDGKTFLEIMMEKGNALGIEELYISGYEPKRNDIHVVWDIYTERGPLGGLHACMKQINTPFCLVVPVDAPKLSVEILEDLLIFHEKNRDGLKGEREIPLLWHHGERIEPLIAVYPVNAAEEIEEVIREKSAPVFRALDRTGYECFHREMEEEQIINVNTPELYEELLKSIERDKK